MRRGLDVDKLLVRGPLVSGIRLGARAIGSGLRSGCGWSGWLGLGLECRTFVRRREGDGVVGRWVPRAGDAVPRVDSRRDVGEPQVVGRVLGDYSVRAKVRSGDAAGV